MARHGKKRSQLQQQRTEEMRKQGLALGFPSTADVIEPVDPRAASKMHKNDVKEANAQRRLAHNARRREERLKEKVDKQVKVNTFPTWFVQKVNGRPQAIDSLKSELRDANNELEDRLKDSQGEVHAWKEETKKRKVEVGRLKDHVRRFVRVSRCTQGVLTFAYIGSMVAFLMPLERPLRLPARKCRRTSLRSRMSTVIRTRDSSQQLP